MVCIIAKTTQYTMYATVVLLIALIYDYLGRLNSELGIDFDIDFSVQALF